MDQTLLRKTTPPGPYILTATEQPTGAQLHAWWESMQRDDLGVAYADSFPATLCQFQAEVARGEKLLLLCLANDQVAGAMWLHDLVQRPNGIVHAGWIGCYFLSPYRGHPAVDLWQVVRQHWEAQGIAHFFVAIHSANRRSQAFVARGAHFSRVGRYPQFTVYHGQPTDMCIYTLHAEDSTLAWQLAEERATRQMLGVGI